MGTHLLRTVGTLVLTGMALGCREDAELPSAPEISPSLAASLTTALVFRQVTGGNESSCGVTTDNLAFCWGWNSDGQLGDGTINNASRPVAVSGGLRFRNIIAGFADACGLTTDSRAYCWGANLQGQLGDGTTTACRRPVRVAGGLSFAQITVVSRLHVRCDDRQDGVLLGIQLVGPARRWHEDQPLKARARPR